MDTARYLRVLLGTIELARNTQNKTNDQNKYLQSLSSISPELVLPSTGEKLSETLKLIAEANEAQAYITNLQVLTPSTLTAELNKFRNSRGFSKVTNEYMVVSTQRDRPRQFKLGQQPVETPTSPPQTPPAVETPPPAEAVEASEEETPKEESKEKTAEKKIGGGGAKPKSTPAPTPGQGQVRPTQETKVVSAAPTKRNLEDQPKVDISLPRNEPQKTPARSLQSKTASPRFGQGQVRPSQILGPLKQPVKNLGNNLGSQLAVQIIRHPLMKTRILTTILGAAGGYLIGGPSGAGAGAVLGGTFGPQIGSSVLNYMTGGREDGGGSTGGSGGSGRRSGGGILNTAQNMGRDMASQAARRAALAAGRAVAGFVVANFWWIAAAIGVAVIIFIILLMLLCVLPLSGCVGGSAGDITKQILIQKTAPAAVDNGVSIEYKIQVSNKGNSTANVTVFDDIPDKTVYVSGNNDEVTDIASVKRLQWSIKGLAAGQNRSLNFTVIPQATDTWIINRAQANAQIIGGPTGGDVSIPGNVPPTADNCNGTYPLKNPLGNFGDPQCNFMKNDLHMMLKQLDPANADIWFLEVARCESNYSPNAYADPIAVGTPDSAGAWGLFQMGRGKNGDLDHGDVIWQLQTSNAVTYSNKIPNKWGYWQCAKHRW